MRGARNCHRSPEAGGAGCWDGVPRDAARGCGHRRAWSGPLAGGLAQPHGEQLRDDVTAIAFDADTRVTRCACSGAELRAPDDEADLGQAL